jgi:DNA-3-methyladenine glycosylase II
VFGVDTKALLGPDPGKLREAGLSWRKIGTLCDLAERLSDGRLNLDVLSSLPDDELLAELTAIPGIGPWTVQGALTMNGGCTRLNRIHDVPPSS